MLASLRLIGAPRSCVLGHVTHIDPIVVAQVSHAGHKICSRCQRAEVGKIRCEKGLGRAGTDPVSRAHAALI